MPFRTPRGRRFALRPLAAAFASPLALSITATPAAAQSTDARSQQLAPVVVTGNPLRSDTTAAPVSVLDGDALLLQRGTTLGETLAATPGVSATQFGPNASRPVIRGLDGDRVRILSNAGASFDAASLSFDHSVPIDPLVVERIEVLRGPATLLYGGGAVGGVVNTIDNRIPRAPVTGPTGAAELRLGGAEHERGGGALVEAGDGRFAWHADAFGRETSDLRVPRFTPQEDGAALPESDRVRNSASRASGGALGGAWTFGSGYLGASVDRYDSRYGIVAEPDVTIRMQREHAAVAGEWRDLGGPLRTLRAQWNRTRYAHDEIEGSGDIGTRFRTKGDSARLEAEHAPWAGVRGVVGVQLERSDFSALGAEAFVPATTTRSSGVFAVEQTAWALGTLSAGLRVERTRVASAGDADPADAKFGPPSQRSFTLRSASLANAWPIAPGWTLETTLSHSERAPTSFELYANGVHAATAAYERGDTTLEPERGANLDVAFAWRAGDDRLRLGAYAARFSRFISLDASGATVDVTADDGSVESVPEFVFRPVRARLQGVEVDGRKRLLTAPWSLDLAGRFDVTRGRNADTGEALPRLAPWRAALGLEAGQGPWTLRGEVQHAARQTNVPATDVPTDGYTLLNLSVLRRFTLGSSEAVAFVKLDNALDELAYNATTVRTVRELSPLPGRSLKLGMRVAF